MHARNFSSHCHANCESFRSSSITETVEGERLWRRGVPLRAESEPQQVLSSISVPVNHDDLSWLSSQGGKDERFCAGLKPVDVASLVRRRRWLLLVLLLLLLLLFDANEEQRYKIARDLGRIMVGIGTGMGMAMKMANSQWRRDGEGGWEDEWS